MSKTITSAEYNAWLEHPLTKGLKRSFQQSITDPENQPSQYGTVTLEMYEALEDQLAAAQEEWNQCSGLLDDAHRSIEMLEDQLATAEQRVAEAIVDMLQQKHRNCFGAHNLYLAASVATKNGEWRKFVKEV